ncbi:MAG: hypothetical protein GWO08_11905, partial [Gammaproteobacteria bacterium]|nr:hypothetical protein [Gammaproteobacteria bacterium]NIQ10555.1 hypothetical protein [Gammaproteobacteria bacterium]NIQ76132.1 hypothetical protein [Gammaproteobacteria bacterium]NIR27262.1 hypothetical protein [Gammaproteobacteria bacterium]NIR94334.1 hypothetical protein [Gammaproteobacteria bacterium]
STHRNFIDTDLLLSGLLVQELSDGFDTYWNSRWAVPVEELISFTLVSDDLALLRQRIDDRLASYPELTALVDPARIEETIMSLGKAHELDEASILLDSPDVTWGEKPDEIANALAEVTRSTHLEILIVSPYLVPTKRMLDIGRELEERGVKIRIVTNSLASNDVVMAHAAYANFRRTILDIDLELYEFRGDPAIMRNNQAENYSLHSKFILFDEWIFLGSPNLDPRSLQLNTELAVLLRSQTLSAELRNYFYQLIDPDNAWRVESEANNLVWRSSSGTLDRQPAKSSWQRFQSWLMMLLPVKNQL